ncbi:peroxiredoxin [Haematospirillum jordaniae]|uniref:peroxiredoxin n=1 Tax=Haematospirillum jordaniae TaxID=1549855 RepID=UPI001432DBA1|nr:peroxiredoxin [Haematospirillum jordaniae]NKD86467.1 peroxiredoxin [Haematospirillum jordaniae]
MNMMTGQPAPAFDLPASGGGRVSLAALQDRIVVLYFYPKDLTSGCTTEAENFRDLHDDFLAAGAVVLGVSRDSVRKHDQFVEKHSLPFPLLSDEETGSLCEAYGVWVEKSMYGRKYMGIDRSTFLIAPGGEIAQEWRKVKVPGHAAAVLEAVRQISA